MSLVGKLTRRIENTLTARALRSWLQGRQPLEEAPYPLSLYSELLDCTRKHDWLNVRDYAAPTAARGRPALYFRHDIDTQQCVDRMTCLLDEDLRAGVLPGVYLRADEREYCLAEVRSKIEPYRARGVEFGLHTVCYLEDQFLSELAREANHFERSLGFRARSLTTHGLGDHRLEVRLSFCQQIRSRSKEFGFDFLDIDPRVRSYLYVIEDCHRHPRSGCRFIYDDFKRFPWASIRHGDLLVLTHPCYWQP